MNPSPRSIAILGAGVTGLTAAHRLARQGCAVRVFERGPRTGGAIGSELAEGWLVERGPNTVLESGLDMPALIKELGLEGERIEANATAKKRFIVRGGRALATPASPVSFFTTPLFSLGAKCRIMGEILARPRVRPADVSLEELVRSHFGSEVVTYGLNPFVSGVYAGNAKKLSARHAFPTVWESERSHGSLIRGLLAGAKARKARGEPRGRMVSFRRGLQTLTDTLSGALPTGTVTLNARIEALIGSPCWTVVWSDGGAVHSEEFDLVLSALPASGLASLRFGALGEQPLAAVEAIEQPPVASLFLGYRRDQVRHPLDGFGVLVPEVEKLSVLGVLFSSTLFPGRAPEGHVALTVMAGGARQPEVAMLELPALLRRIQPDLVQLLGVTGEPLFLRHTLWPQAIPQYNLGYERYFDTMNAAETGHPGFLIGGQARDGIAVSACIAAGEKLARRALAA
ncbi:MAG: protoporphyrinogen oxidase [Opitutales bacterium]